MGLPDNGADFHFHKHIHNFAFKIIKKPLNLVYVHFFCFIIWYDFYFVIMYGKEPYVFLYSGSLKASIECTGRQNKQSLSTLTNGCNQWCVGKCLMTRSLRTRALICSVCYFPRCAYSHHGRCQVVKVTSRNTLLRRGVWLIPLSLWEQSPTPC